MDRIDPKNLAQQYVNVQLLIDGQWRPAADGRTIAIGRQSTVAHPHIAGRDFSGRCDPWRVSGVVKGKGVTILQIGLARLWREGTVA